MTMTDFEINDASDSCFDLAEDSNVTLRDGEMNDRNSDGNSWGGAVVNFPVVQPVIDIREHRNL